MGLIVLIIVLLVAAVAIGMFKPEWFSRAVAWLTAAGIALAAWGDWFLSFFN